MGTGQANGRATNLFEPADEYKGDFARMYLYFVTCYQDYSWKSSALSMFAQNSYPTLNAYGQSLLLKWHRQDPVSQKEIDRNNAVYSFQGNRNPFIDYPNMVEYIWGDSTNYEFSFSGQSTSAPSISISNDKIEFGYIGTETSKDKEIYIKGKNLTTDITAKLLNNDSGDFSLGMSNLPAPIIERRIICPRRHNHFWNCTLVRCLLFENHRHKIDLQEKRQTSAPDAKHELGYTMDCGRKTGYTSHSFRIVRRASHNTIHDYLRNRENACTNRRIKITINHECS